MRNLQQGFTFRTRILFFFFCFFRYYLNLKPGCTRSTLLKPTLNQTIKLPDCLGDCFKQSYIYIYNHFFNRCFMKRYWYIYTYIYILGFDFTWTHFLNRLFLFHASIFQFIWHKENCIFLKMISLQPRDDKATKLEMGYWD